MDKNEQPAVLFGKAKWIWTANEPHGASYVIMRRKFTMTEKPSRAFCRAACDTHYYLYVNGNAVVWCGGMPRSAGRAYYDEFDISKFLVKGDNVIVCYCQYFGAEGAGRDLVPSARAGFIFECNDLNIFSDSQFTVYESVAYKTPRPSNCCSAGRNVFYDASLEGQIQNLLDPAFNSSLFVNATELSEYPDTVDGVLSLRPLPLERFSAQPVISRPKRSTDQFDGDTYTISLPREMTVTPYMEVTGNGQEKITITTDRTECQGCFGDEGSTYTAHFVEYTTKPTLNIFEFFLPMTGNSLVFTMPRTVKVLKLGYREIGYNTVPTGDVETDSDRLDALYEKARNTLYCCMGSTLMDTPERERTMWLGDASVEARALYLAYNGATALVKKTIDDITAYAKDDVLFSCVPGNVPVDIPAHGLIALSEYGLFAQYRNFTDDLEFFRAEYEHLCDYLMLWEMTEHGVALREGNRRWYDNLFNIDDVIIENALYYSACKFLKGIGAAISEHDYDETFDDRMANIAEYIDSRWDGIGYSSREDGYDDRANAWAVLAGLVPDDSKTEVARLLAADCNASPYMEWAVLEALCKLGRRDLARGRFEARYATAAENEFTTLGEDFAGFGTKCQGYQSAVIFEIVQLFCGIDISDGSRRITVTPDFRAMKDARVRLELASGELDVRYKYSPTRVDITVDNRTSGKVELVIEPECVDRATERRTILLNKGKNKFAI